MPMRGFLPPAVQKLLTTGVGVKQYLVMWCPAMPHTNHFGTQETSAHQRNVPVFGRHSQSPVPAGSSQEPIRKPAPGSLPAGTLSRLHFPLQPNTQIVRVPGQVFSSLPADHPRCSLVQDSCPVLPHSVALKLPHLSATASRSLKPSQPHRKQA